jgi:hypothetical protein
MIDKRKIEMDKLKKIVEGVIAGDKIKALARRIHVSKNTIKTYRNIIKKAQEENPIIANDSKAILEIFKDLRKEEKSTNFKWLQENKDWINNLFSRCTNLVVIYKQLSVAGFKGSYSSFSRYLNKIKESKEPPIIRMETLPGEYAQVDFGSIGMIF